MKTSTLIIVAFMLVTPFFMAAQAVPEHVGDWMYELTQEDGSKVPIKLTLQNNGMILSDIGNDGTIDVFVVYTINEDKITIRDVNTDSACYDIIGVYQLKIKGGTNTVKVVHDPCESRRNGHADIQMKRMQ
jgi:hypothetical protein